MAELPGSWELEFHRRVVTFLARHGTLVVEDSTSSYDSWWHDYSREGEKVTRHIRSCELDAPKCTWDDKNWSEFNGTGEMDRYVKGIEVSVHCSCGKVRGRRVRYEDGFAKLVRAITAGAGT